MFLVGLSSSASRPFSLRTDSLGRNDGLLHEPSSHCVHFAFLRLRRVIVADQMQDPVGQEEAHFLEQPAFSAQCLAFRGVERDHDVAEPARAFTADLVVEWKREYVRRLILVSMTQIQLLDLPVIREEHAELAVRELERGEHRVGQALNFSRSEDG